MNAPIQIEQEVVEPTEKVMVEERLKSVDTDPKRPFADVKRKAVAKLER